MKIVLDYDKIKALAEYKGIKKMSVLCQKAKVNYYAVLNNRYHKSGISIEIAWKLAVFFDCDIRDIVKPEYESGD